MSYLLGHRVVDKAMADPRVSNFLRAYFAEVAATVPEVPGVDLEQYQFSLITRFSNVHICDQVGRQTTFAIAYAWSIQQEGESGCSRQLCLLNSWKIPQDCVI